MPLYNCERDDGSGQEVLEPLDLHEYVDYTNAGQTMTCIMQAQTAVAGPQKAFKLISTDYGSI